jgi:hypothetical protein
LNAFEDAPFGSLWEFELTVVFARSRFLQGFGALPCMFYTAKSKLLFSFMAGSRCFDDSPKSVTKVKKALSFPVRVQHGANF